MIALMFAGGCGARTVLDLADYTNGPTSDGGRTGSGSGSGSGSNGGSGGSSGAGSGGGSGGVSGSTSGGSSGGVAQISCGAQSCDPTSQECCVTLGGPGGPPMESCGPKGQCMGDLTLHCTGTSSCPNNEVCCFSTRGGVPQTRCATRCRSGGGGGPSGQLCMTDQDCPMGQQCMMTPLGFGVCFGGGGGGGGGFGGGGGGGTGGNPGSASSSSGG